MYGENVDDDPNDLDQNQLEGQDGDPDDTDVDDAESDGEDEPIDKSRIYWALWKGKDLVSAFSEKTQQFYETARMRGLLTRWIIAYAAHHGATPEDLRELATMVVGFTGSEAERARFHINLIRSYNRHAAIMALGEKAAFKAKTVNSDHQSLAKAELSDKIVNGLYQRYYEVFDPQVAEGDGFAGAAGTHTRWDFKSGDDVKVNVPVTDPDTGEQMRGDPSIDPQTGEQIEGAPLTHPKQVKSGAAYVTLFYPWCKVGETRAAGQELWGIIRETESKWNLIGQFGEQFRDDILRQNTKLDQYDFATLFNIDLYDYDDHDLLTVQHFYHARCAAIPEGRYVVMVGDVILWDGPCPVKEGLPYSEMKSSKFVESEFPYCDGWDLISMNQALNQCSSDELQNLSLFSRQSTYSEKGSNVTINGLTGGTHYELPQGAKPPGAIMLASMPPSEPFKQYVLGIMDRISGQNGTTRGEPDANVRSGEMAALLDSISIRYQSFRQQAARRYRVRNAQIILDMISRYGETPFLVDIAGVEDRGYVYEFTKDDISGIQRVDMDVVSPMMQTVSGRYQFAQQLLLLKDPKDRAGMYDFVITGDPDSLLKRDRSSKQLIRRENEKLILDTEDVQVNATDNPWEHVPDHVAQIERMQSSDQPDLEAIDRLRKHVLQHWSVYVMYTQPVIAQFLGFQPPPPIGPSPSAPGGNAAFEFQMQLTAGAQVLPMPNAPLDATGNPQQPPTGGAKPPSPTAGAGQPQADPGAQATTAESGIPQTHPSGTKLPSPSTPPAQSQQGMQ